MRRIELVFAFIFSFIISGILVGPLFIQGPQQETTFDGPTHMQTIAQFTHGLRDGDFPVRWGDGFARYGMPIPMVSQQLTAYLGAVINLVVNNVQLSYRLVFFLGAWLSTFLMYYFLRKHVSMYPALGGTFLFNLAPYRIVNIYIRGALPEFFASVCVILALIGLHEIFHPVEKHRVRGHLLWIIGIAGLILTHPFVLIIASPLIGGYALYCFAQGTKSQRQAHIIQLVIGTGIAGLLSAYYVLPLLKDIHYFNYSSADTHYVANQFLSLKSYFREVWEFFGPDVATRGNILQSGIFEGMILLIGIGVSVVTFMRSRTITLVQVATVIGVIYCLSTLSVTDPLYLHTFLGNIQHPWRMLSGWIIVIPLIGAVLFEKIPHRFHYLILLTVMLCTAWLRFPQLYTKNTLHVDEKSYYVTHENTHGLIMNTVWMGDAREYPYQPHKGNIVEGEGKIISRQEQNARRQYSVQAQSPIRMVDYTFYFPGWHATVDGTEVPIQFQDPSYRGIITYMVPAGTHEVTVVFENTLVRTLANSMSIVGLICLGLYGYFLQKIFETK